MRTQIAPFSPTQNEQQLIVILNNYGKNSWDQSPLVINGTDYTNQRDNLKNRIDAHLRNAQDNYCAYCANDPDKHRDIDHFAKKSTFGNLTWDVNNLLSSCVTCNRVRKFNKNFVTNFTTKLQRVNATTATQLIFDVVNPLLVNPTQHIDWGNNFILCNGSFTPIGEKTIKIFELTTNISTFARSATHNLRLLEGEPVDEDLIKSITAVPRIDRQE